MTVGAANSQNAAAASKALSLAAVMAPFVGRDHLSNRELFEQLALSLDIPEPERQARVPVGKSGEVHNLFERKVRWYQQTLKRLGVLERVDRGTWRLSADARQKLTPAPRKAVMLAFSTTLGCALWGNAEDVFSNLGEQVTLAFTSPPYPLARQRSYGGVDRQHYVDWLLQVLEPVVACLRPGGSLVLNLGNDIFEPGSPARSLYIERLTLALHDRLGLHLMDRFVWHNPAKPPGPTQWACMRPLQHVGCYEHVLWFTNDPSRVLSNNRRCLQEHTQRHQRLMRSGGVRESANYADGAYSRRPGNFGGQTEGALPRNVLSIRHNDPSQKTAREFAAQHGLPVHPALMPLKLAEHFVRFLTEEGDLMVDQFAGWATSGLAAELNNRRWVIAERCREYLQVAAERFRGAPGFQAMAA
jgi:site-specific DNA-methyltransferase (cytosine-N4-specific)